MSFNHSFFCSETYCRAEAHVLGGRCDRCFEAHVAQERREHNPPRCGWCTVAMPHPKSKRFCGAHCQTAYLHDHNCNVWDSDLDDYACPECRDCFPPGCVECGKSFSVGLLIDPSRCPTCILNSQFPCMGQPCNSVRAASVHVCNGDMDYERGHKVCDESDDPDCPQYRESSITSPRPKGKFCTDCGVQRTDTEPELLCEWFCKPCWNTRFTH